MHRHRNRFESWNRFGTDSWWLWHMRHSLMEAISESAGKRKRIWKKYMHCESTCHCLGRDTEVHQHCTPNPNPAVQSKLRCFAFHAKGLQLSCTKAGDKMRKLHGSLETFVFRIRVFNRWKTGSHLWFGIASQPASLRWNWATVSASSKMYTHKFVLEFLEGHLKVMAYKYESKWIKRHQKETRCTSSMQLGAGMAFVALPLVGQSGSR